MMQLRSWPKWGNYEKKLVLIFLGRNIIGSDIPTDITKFEPLIDFTFSKGVEIPQKLVLGEDHGHNHTYKKMFLTKTIPFSNLYKFGPFTSSHWGKGDGVKQ